MLKGLILCTHTSKRCLGKILFGVGVVFFACSALAGGSIFGGGGGSHAKNKDGVNSIGVHICGNLSCPDVIIRKGDCKGIENAFMQYGVCTCMDGYKVSGNQCVLKEDKCKGKKLNDCQESCDPKTGKITNKPDDTACITDTDEKGACHSGECVNLCTETPIEHCTNCITESGKAVCKNCESGYEVKDNVCVKACSINPETDCLSGALVEGECACAPVADGTPCTSWTNNECGKGKYCVFSPTGCGDDDHGTGTCRDVGYVGDEKTATVDGHEYTMSDCSNCPDWWSAQSWCKAHNKTMVSLSDLHCSGDSWSCSDNLWEDLGNALYQYGIWTTDMYDSCSAFYVDLLGGTVINYGRDSGYDVLCR